MSVLYILDCVTNDFVDGININQAMIKSGYCVRDKYWLDRDGYLPWELDVKAMAEKYGVSVVIIHFDNEFRVNFFFKQLKKF